MLETDIHDEVVRYVAATRFPFPGQTDWPAENVTITNEKAPIRGISTDAGISYPDIVVIDSRSDRIVEIGEVETSVTQDNVAMWRLCSSVCKQSSTGAKSFFVYVPDGAEDEARGLLESAGISYAGLRTWVYDTGQVRITPILTPGDAKDHR